MIYDLTTNHLVAPTTLPPSEVYTRYFNKVDNLIAFNESIEYLKPLAKAYAREEDGGELLLLAAVVRQDMGKLRCKEKWNVPEGGDALKKVSRPLLSRLGI